MHVASYLDPFSFELTYWLLFKGGAWFSLIMGLIIYVVIYVTYLYFDNDPHATGCSSKSQNVWGTLTNNGFLD